MVPKAHLTLHFKMSGSRQGITPLWLSGSLRSFLYSSSVYTCHLFLISSVSIRVILVLSFIVPISPGNVPLVSLLFLKRSLVFPILLFSSISLYCSLGKLSYLSLLFFGTLHPDGYIFPLPFTSLLFLALCKASSDTHFAFLNFFSLGMVLITTSYTVLQTFVHSSSGTLSIRPFPLNLFVPSTL